MKFWHNISNAGLLPADDMDFRRKAQLINRMCFISSIILIMFVPFIYFIGNTFFAPILIGFSVACSAYYFFSRARHFYFAICWMWTVTLGSIFWGSIETPGSGVEYFAIPLSMMPFTVFDRRVICVALVVVAAITILSSYFIQQFYIPHCIVPPFFVEVTYVMVITSVFGAAALIITQFRIVNSQYENIIREQKIIVESKNKDIIDSINYAKRIQTAKLPKMDEILGALPQSFILFKPKDIVSGDFYYFSRKDNNIFIAAADCTGHGVPGALMTMLSSEKLEDSIARTNDTSEILRLVNTGMKASLRQTSSDESTRDGMDIVLCRIDREKCTVSFAGANRPLWIIRKNADAVEEIKATKRSIGGHTPDEEHFESHAVQLQVGDTIYLTTDGYADTFGGKENKKLTTKKFKELLIRVREKPMAEQEKYLDHFLEEWKGETEQLDDVLVIGVRF